MKSRLFEIANKLQFNSPYTKPLKYYEKYDIFLNNHNLFPKTILEIGTHEGHSTKIISKAFEKSNILTLDFDIKNIDFKDYKNIIYKKADQTKKDQLIPLIKEYFPKGIDLVIDDASHIGCYSKLTFDIVLPFVNPGGAYFIEDWGTGYWDSWVDGGNFVLRKFNDDFRKNFPSHDFGMVGFVKSLIDLLGEDKSGKKIYFDEKIKHIEFWTGACMLIKSNND